MGSIAYPARHAVARSAKAGRWADDAGARVVELVREDSLQATGRYTDVKNAIAEVGYCLHVARRLGYISDSAYDNLDLAVRRVGAPLSGVIQRARATQH